MNDGGMNEFAALRPELFRPTLPPATAAHGCASPIAAGSGRAAVVTLRHQEDVVVWATATSTNVVRKRGEPGGLDDLDVGNRSLFASVNGYLGFARSHSTADVR
jgi:hypothetical protein